MPDAVNHQNYKIFMNDFRVNGGINNLATLIDGYTVMNKTKTSMPKNTDNSKTLYVYIYLLLCL